jgi:hypothetical protein
MPEKNGGRRVRALVGKSGKIMRSAAAVFLMCLAFAPAARAFGSDYADWRPVVFSYAWGPPDEASAWLIGGFKGGEWRKPAELPIMVDGRPITPEEAMELSEPAVCSTPMLKSGDKLFFYSAGKRVGDRTVARTRYSCSPASMESFVDVEIDGLEMPPHSMAIGVGGGWNAVTSPTERRLDKESAVFSVSGDEISVTFAPDVDEYGEKIYRGFLSGGGKGGKKWPLTEGCYVDDLGLLEGLFIDLNGDGAREFVLYCPGTAGFVAAFELSADGLREVLYLDL